MMDRLIEAFPKQISDSLDKTATLTLTPPDRDIHNIFLAGLGGSGISGNYMLELLKESSSIPYVVGKGYDIPHFVNKNTLFIASSYSGNTEETVRSLKQAIDQGAYIVCITTGGEIERVAREYDLQLILLPQGEKIPRAYLGTSLTHQLAALVNLGLAPKSLLKDLRASVDLLKFNQDEIKKQAQEVAAAIKGTIPIIYTTDRNSSVAVRLCQQINENAKQLCWSSIIPEMNHNELVGWDNKEPNISAMYLLNKDDFKRNVMRVKINQEIIEEKARNVIEIYSKGKSLIEKMLYLTHMGDFISLYLAQENGKDPVPVHVIDRLKGALSKF